METQHFIKTLCQQKVKTFFLSSLIALNLKPRINDRLIALGAHSKRKVIVWALGLDT